MIKKVFVVIFILFLFLEANAFSEDSCSKKNIGLSTILDFGFELIPDNKNRGLPPNTTDSKIKGVIGFKHSVYINNKFAGLGGGLGVEFFTFKEPGIVAFPIFLSTRIGGHKSNLGLIFKVGSYFTQANFDKIQFFDVGKLFKPIRDSEVFFSLNYRNINYKYNNQRLKLYENLLLNVGFILD